MGMRTDQLTMCPDCAIRFARSPACPRCAAPSVDMTSEPERRAALQKLRRLTRWSQLTRPLRRPSPGLYVGSLVTGIIVLTLGIGTALVLWFDSPALGMVAYFLVPTVCTVLWVLFLPGADELTERLRPLPSVTRPLRLHRVERKPAVNPVRGRVALLEPVRSPLGGARCAAFRLVGRAGPIEIDDAGIGRFEVVVEGEPRAVVSVGAAGVLLEVAVPTSVESTERLVEFLRPRGVESTEPVRAAEAILRDGDPVLVVGGATREPRAQESGYRSTVQVMAFEDTVDEPVWIEGVPTATDEAAHR